MGEAHPLLAQAACIDEVLFRHSIKKRVVAEQFPPLLREWKEYSGAINGTCPQEPQFRELFEVLGDGQAQQDIRLAHPKVQHCDKLQINPKACIGCALNPMKPEKLEKQDRIEAGQPWLQAAYELDESSKLGLLTMQTLNSTEQILLSASRAHHEFDRDERLAILIANKMGEILSVMFGGK